MKYPVPPGRPIFVCGCCCARIVTVPDGHGGTVTVDVPRLGEPDSAFPQRGAEHGKRCRGCKAQICWTVNAASGKRQPFDLDGTPHHATCPKREQFKSAP